MVFVWQLPISSAFKAIDTCSQDNQNPTGCLTYGFWSAGWIRALDLLSHPEIFTKFNHLFTSIQGIIQQHNNVCFTHYSHWGERASELMIEPLTSFLVSDVIFKMWFSRCEVLKPTASLYALLCVYSLLGLGQPCLRTAERVRNHESLICNKDWEKLSPFLTKHVTCCVHTKTKT